VAANPLLAEDVTERTITDERPVAKAIGRF
jgi:hypothetical protein